MRCMKDHDEALKKIRDKYADKRVKIIEPGHPWINEIGIFKDIQWFGSVGKWGVIVELIEQGGHEVTVFSGGRGIKVI
jgi:hypothetical protein